jgi:hypothetical protein
VCQRLGWSFIPAVFYDNDSAIDRELWEIDENLRRAELTPSEEASHLKRRKELWERREIQVGELRSPELGYKKPPPAEKGFAAETADATGKSKRTIKLIRPLPEPTRSPPTFSASSPALTSTQAQRWTKSPAFLSSSNAVLPPRHVLATRGGTSAMIAGGCYGRMGR